MNILHVTWSNPSTDSRVLKAIAVAVSGGHRVHAVGVADVDAMSATKGNEIEGCSYVAWHLASRKLTLLPKPLRHFLTWIEFSIRVLIYTLKSTNDLIHIHDYQPIPAMWILKRLREFRLVYEAHELESEANGVTKTQGRVILFFERLIWPDVENFITVSQSISDWYLEKLGERRSSIIFNSPMAFVSDSSDTYREIFESLRRGGGYSIVYVGFFIKGRGLERIVRVFETLDQKYHLFLIGKGPLEAQLRSMTNELNNVTFLSPVSHSEVVSVLRSADLGLCLVENISMSDYYALPNKLFEYLFAALPMLASDFPEIRRLSEEVGGIGRLVDPADNSQIRNAIIEITGGNYGRQMPSAETLSPYLGVEQYKTLAAIYGEKSK